MKVLFLIFHGFEAYNGISKKIHQQVKALKDGGLDVRVCSLDDTGKSKRRMIDDDVLVDYGGGIKGKILKRIAFDPIADYVVSQRIGLVYVRYVHNASPFVIRLMRKLRQAGVKIVMEIPTYPYDHEYKGLPAPYQIILFFDRLFRKGLAKYTDRIVTFSDDERIWGRPTIRISNGIDFDAIRLKQPQNDETGTLHLIAVATIHPWHGFDRAIRGLAEYYKKKDDGSMRRVKLHIVGSAVPKVMKQYQQLVEREQLANHVEFHGPLYGKALDRLFDRADFAIGSLARHRSNIEHIRTLKNREYAARGIPFVYSETDQDFEQMPYILKAPADETPLDIGAIIRFRESLTQTPLEIRQSIEGFLSWKSQMQQVIYQTFNSLKKEYNYDETLVENSAI